MQKNLKNLLAGFCLAIISTSALADNDIDIAGRVTAVRKNSISINGTAISVTPYTKIEAEYRRGDYDRRIPLSNIRVGEWAKVEAIPQGRNRYIAKDIEVKR